MRRLYSTFARGAPGAGLLLVRLAFGTDLTFHAVVGLTGAGALATHLDQALSAVLGVSLVVGFWMPVSGVLLAIQALAHAFAYPPDAWPSVLLSAVGLALALLGPGAWSIDARLFGWKRIEIPDNGSGDPRAH